MPNGSDKNFFRLCAALDQFRYEYGSWPRLIRLRPDYVRSLREMLTEESFEALAAKVRIVEEENALFIAEDDLGRRATYDQDPPDEWWESNDAWARDWLGVDTKEEWHD